MTPASWPFFRKAPYGDTILVFGYGYNLLTNPGSEADIIFCISGKRVIRNQTRSKFIYPYPITAQNNILTTPGKDHKVAKALSRLPTERLDSTPLDEDIPVLAIETRASDALDAAFPAEAPMGALSAQEIILGQADDAFCQERPTPSGLGKPSSFESRMGSYADTRCMGGRPKWLSQRRCNSASYSTNTSRCWPGTPALGGLMIPSASTFAGLKWS